MRWYITCKLNYQDLRAMMAEQGINVAHPTILRWMQRYIPAFAKHWQRYARPVGRSWRVDEAYSKLKGSIVLSTK